MMSNNSTESEDQDVRTINHLYHAMKIKSRSQLVEDSNNKKNNISWNFDNFIKICIEKYPSIKWHQVVMELDRPHLYFKDFQALLIFLKTFKKLPKSVNFQFPIAIIFNRWRNPSSQIEFLISLIRAGQPDVISFSEIKKKTAPLEKCLNLKISNLNSPMLQFFSSLDILEILIESSESDYYPSIRELFDAPVSKCSEMLVLSLAYIKPKAGNLLLNELYSQTLPTFISNTKSSSQILEALWMQNSQILIITLSELYKISPSEVLLSNALEISQIIKDSLNPMLNSDNYQFAISLAILASKKGLIQFDKWLEERIKTTEDDLIPDFVRHLDVHVVEPCKNAKQDQYLNILEKSNLTTNLLVAVFQVLKHETTTDKLSQRNKELIEDIFKKISEYFPDVASQTSWPEIEAEATKYFEQTFEERLSIQELTEKMIASKSSSNQREKDLFLCMMTNLLDEARFFSTYKPRILMIMAQIYGIVINKNLVEGQARDVAYKIIIETLKNKEDKKLVDFGVKAIDGFKQRLYEWPTKAAQLFTIENLWEKTS